jgi:hypothetical protein
VDVFTGTFDTLALADVQGVKMYRCTVPVPKFYYRIGSDKVTNKGVALVGANNPYVTLEELENDHMLCEN